MIVSLLTIALLAVAVFAVALFVTNRQLRASIAYSNRRADDNAGQVQYWLSRYSERQDKLTRYRDGLQAVVNLRTDKMANIGYRMSAAAAEALRG